MLETVTKGFRAAKNRLAGKSELTPELVDESLRDIRVSLLEADVAFDVVKKFVARVREKSVGELVQTTITDTAGQKRKVSPMDHFIKICHDELEALMGPVDTSLKLKPKGQLSGIMMVGLQGSGKTTTTGKLASRLLQEGRKPLLVAADIYRPAAVDQLKVLGERLKVPVYHEPGIQPPELAKRGYAAAREQKCDVVLIDTAGRLAIDESLMAELESIKGNVQPDNILLVCDAMIGQDAVRTAAEFDRRLTLDGFILTKLDGDARGGAALSIKEVTGKPIKFLGMGESMDKLEEFRPAGLAGRILGFGDIVGLMKDFEKVVDEKKAEEDAKKLLSGQFTMKDFVEQIRMVRKMGPLKDLLEKFPLFGDLTEHLNPDEKELTKIESMYDSMTAKERLRPDTVNNSRINRIAKGSGRKVEEVKELLQKFGMMQQVMGTIGQNPGLLGRIPGFKQLGQLSQMKNMDLSSMFGGDPKMMEKMMSGGMPGMGMPMQLPQIAPGYTPPMGQAAMAKARLMGYAPPSAAGKSEDRDAIKERRKREKENKKKNRKKK
ncbi:signal recognition particle protein [Myxococcus xanthus DK 1622]|uniref:Signal recognition particle protein n=1 Tax=Myxococcus xanthus (strain DK1622) TaxID=246197 RepID=Q1D2W0_MYXXD|nr:MULTISPECIES: signal recognition particle protein [Myxococcus]ABF92485.1 signal recognition particle protein [Myxococcus xanthus DK 1622]NOJ56318.1 signal recognition particle protein [Myxococcus xanthus]QPM77390.1 signal recognition particle protein [Myxococcus xanthus]QVW66457.1 signal recognition particle protein [Myxococcus xanthus DZ2]QZZ52526.1 Signal recognition particle 54 kDa protein [Myxococcus xanthus]